MSLGTIGIAGTGRMGTAIARRLLESGASVIVWNRTSERTAAAVEAGAKTASSPAALMDGCGTVLSSVTDSTALEAVYLGNDGLLAGDVKGKLVVEMSTVLPREQLAIANAVSSAGADFIECPVGGTVAPALKGQLLGLAGGTEQAWQRAKPLLQKLCKRVDHIGDVGTGSQMKLAVNLPLAIYWNVLGESFRLIEGTGMGGKDFASLLADSSAAPAVLRNRLDLIADALDGSRPEGTFDIDGLTKDLALALRWAEENKASLPVASTVMQNCKQAQAAGLGSLDGACLAHFVKD